MTPSSIKTVAVRVLSAIAAVCILFMMLLTFLDVFLRYWFARPISGSSEMISFSLAMLVFAALPIITVEDAHISVSILSGRLSTYWTWVVEMFMLLFSLISTVLMAYVLFQHGIDLGNNLQTTPVLGLPLAPLSFAMSGSSGLASLAVIVLLAGHFRKPQTLEPKSLDESPPEYEV